MDRKVVDRFVGDLGPASFGERRCWDHLVDGARVRQRKRFPLSNTISNMKTKDVCSQMKHENNGRRLQRVVIFK